MGLRIFVGKEAGYDMLEDEAILFDSVTDIAFGRIFYSTGGIDAHDVAQKFLDWCEREQKIPDGDVRKLAAGILIELQDEFVRELRAIHGDA